MTTSTNVNPPKDLSASRKCTAVVGLQWGDEGKGKAVDLLAAEHDAVVRYNGGANAGHSVVVKGERYSLHLIPSGILYPGKASVIGNGVVVDPWKLMDEVDGLATRGVDTSGLLISSRAHAVLPYHKMEDALREDILKKARGEGGISEIGTTRRGIGPAYAEKAHRSAAIRMGDMIRPEVLKEKLALAVAMREPALEGLARALGVQGERIDMNELTDSSLKVAQRIAPMVKDTTQLLNSLLKSGKRILFEGANGSLLDVDHGTYPFVTASNCTAAGIAAGTGVPPQSVQRVLGIMKAYSTRVGSGPLPTELFNDTGENIRKRGREYGTTTGRPRRVGWLDLVAVRYTAMLNGATGVCMTMLDVLAGMPEVQVCTGYRIGGQVTDVFPADASDLADAQPVYTRMDGFEQDLSSCRRLADLPSQARAYLDFVSDFIQVPIELVSVGPDRAQTIES